MIKIINIKTKPTPSYDLYIGRANKWLNFAESKWANPFPMKRERDRSEVIRKFTNYIIGRRDLIAQLFELDNKTLACYCHNDEPEHKLCHGDILRNLRYKQIKDWQDILFSPILYEITDT